MDKFPLPAHQPSVGRLYGDDNHPGCELIVTPGEPITAPAHIRILEVGTNRSFGRYVIAEQPAFHYIFRFAYLGDVRVRPNFRLKPGDLIGLAGEEAVQYSIMRQQTVRGNMQRSYFDMPTDSVELGQVFVNPAVLHPSLLLLARKRGALQPVHKQTVLQS